MSKAVELIESPVKIRHSPKRFQRLSLKDIDLAKVYNPVIRMLAEENRSLTQGRRGAVSGDDEWIIFLD